MGKTKEMAKKESEMQEINHSKGIMETEKAKFSGKDKPARLNGSIWTWRVRTERVHLTGYHGNKK